MTYIVNNNYPPVILREGKPMNKKNRKSSRKKYLETKRMIQKENLNKLLEQKSDDYRIKPLKDVLFEGKSVAKAAKDDNTSPSTLQKWLDKLSGNDENPFEEKRGGKIKITPEMKVELKNVMKVQPFKLPPVITTNEQGKEIHAYDIGYKWTDGRLKNYIYKHWGIEVDRRTCTNLINELTATNPSILDVIESNKNNNIWFFLKIKLCEKVTFNEKLSVGSDEFSESVDFYALIAYSLATNTIIYDLKPRKIECGKFIEAVCSEEMTDNALIFFIEDISNKKTKEKNALAFCEFQNKIKMLHRTIIPTQVIYDKCKKIKTIGSGLDKSYDVEPTMKWLAKEMFNIDYDDYDDNGDYDDNNDLSDEIEDCIITPISYIITFIKRKMDSADKIESSMSDNYVCQELEHMMET